MTSRWFAKNINNEKLRDWISCQNQIFQNENNRKNLKTSIFYNKRCAAKLKFMKKLYKKVDQNALKKQQLYVQSMKYGNKQSFEVRLCILLWTQICIKVTNISELWWRYKNTIYL